MNVEQASIVGLMIGGAVLVILLANVLVVVHRQAQKVKRLEERMALLDKTEEENEEDGEESIL